MNTYPLFRTTLSNERLMSALLLVLLLYNLPGFISDASSLLRILLLVLLGLMLDTVAHFLIHKRPICAVSAAVTALVLYTLSPGAAILYQCLALMAALVIGKIIWGGIGKNPLNPAMVGLVLLSLFSPDVKAPFTPDLILLPAVLLSLPFLFIRPYAGVGMMLGMTVSLLLRQDLTPQALMAAGVPFWACLVITDPVTTTSRSVAGFVIGAAVGFIPMMTGTVPVALPLGILIFNILSWQVDRTQLGKTERLKWTFGSSRRIRFSPVQTPFLDLTGDDAEPQEINHGGQTIHDRSTIIERIEKNNITGYGGAAFPTIKKLRAALEAGSPDKHLLVNAAECDPGLIHDKWLLTHRRDDIQEGIALLLQCTGFKSVTVAAKNFYGMTFEPPVHMHKVRDYYPAGAEKILIREALNIELKPDEIPCECGILVLNVQTVAAICEAVRRNVTTGVRYITVADPDTLDGHVARVRLGDGVYDTARKIFPNAKSVYAGGGAMSARLADDLSLIDEKTNFLGVGSFKGFREAMCSRCGACSAYCPALLPVREISQLIDAGSLSKAAKLRPENCIECNLCSAVCPAGRDQARRIKQAKKIRRD